MEARLKNEGEVTIVTLKGRMEIEAAQTFKVACRKHFSDKKIVFNMVGVSFVGSTGIQSFLEAIKFVSEQNQQGVKVSGVSPELKRMFDAYELNQLEFFSTDEEALVSFQSKELPSSFDSDAA